MSKPTPRKRSIAPRNGRSRQTSENGSNWLWGSHAVMAARANKHRKINRMIATSNAARRLGIDGAELMTAKDMDRLLPKGAVHQGVAVNVTLLQPVELNTLIDGNWKRLVVLDQIEDPHNLGAIFRSAAAFGFDGVVLQTRHAPELTGVAAKSAAGAIETVSECRVVNIARTLEALADNGYTIVGLSGEGSAALSDCIEGNTPGSKIAIVLGAEGAGIRPSVAKACTHLARIPISQEMESLNVSNAAAIAFYVVSSNQHR